MINWTQREWTEFIGGIALFVTTVYGLYRSWHTDRRAADKESLDALALAEKKKEERLVFLEGLVTTLQGQVQEINDRLAIQTRYIGFLQYMLQRHGVETPSFTEWRDKYDTPHRGVPGLEPPAPGPGPGAPPAALGDLPVTKI